MIVGVGLLGGSIGLALKRLDHSVRVIGVGRRQSSLDAAIKAGAVDVASLDAAEHASQADLVILATPVGAFERHVRAIEPALKRGAVVTDVGSTKAVVCRQARAILGRGGAFVGSHPMAGSHRKGVAAASPDLLVGATCIVTPAADTPKAAAANVETFWKQLGMNTLRMSPAAHDRAVARVSHLPHALSVLLMGLPGDGDLPLAATGFADMTRLAGGDPEMWRDIFLTNPRQVLAALDRFDKSAARLRALIKAGDARALERLLTRAQKRRQNLPRRNS
jgi:prephenate dehydrogenase